MSEEKTNSPIRKETSLNPIRRTTQFCHETLSPIRPPIKRPLTPFSDKPKFQKPPTTYKNSRYKTCQFSPQEIKKSRQNRQALQLMLQ